MIGGKTAYSGEPIAGYYRVPGGFKLSQHVRVPRELLVLPDGIAHLLFPYRYIYIWNLPTSQNLPSTMSCGLHRLPFRPR